jgi:hypothetical protein
MITRRQFVHTSMAASLAALVGCGRDPDDNQPAQAAADGELRLYFVGGTAFVKAGAEYLALQLSGKGLMHGGRSLEHQSYIAGAPELFPGGVPMPAMGPLGEGLVPGSLAVCLLGKTITVDTGEQPNATNRCQRLVDYRNVSGSWKRKGEWDPARNPAISSMFRLRHGVLSDAQAVNQTAASVMWWVKDPSTAKHLSDVAMLDLKGPKITITGATDDPIVIDQGKKVVLHVFAGPLHLHQEGHKYRTITHALLLKSIYDVQGTADADIMPTTAAEVDGETGPEMKNPCNDRVTIRVPPDSEYCPNYGELP